MFASSWDVYSNGGSWTFYVMLMSFLRGGQWQDEKVKCFNNSAWVQAGYNTFFQMLKDLGERFPDASTSSSQSDGNTIISTVLNPYLLERELSCYKIPSPNKTAEFWEMVVKNKCSTIVAITEMKVRKEVKEYLFNAFDGALVYGYLIAYWYVDRGMVKKVGW